MYGAGRFHGLGSFDDDLATETSDAPDAGDPNIQAIHALAQSMAPIRAEVTMLVNNVANADAPMSDADFSTLAADLSQLVTLHQQVAQAIAAYNASNPYAATAGELSNWVSFAVDWVESTLAALPTALVSGAHTIIDATTGAVVDGLQALTNMLSQILANTTKSALSGLSPLLLAVGVGAVALLLFVGKAEKTRTYRRYVA